MNYVEYLFDLLNNLECLSLTLSWLPRPLLLHQKIRCSSFVVVVAAVEVVLAPAHASFSRVAFGDLFSQTGGYRRSIEILYFLKKLGVYKCKKIDIII